MNTNGEHISEEDRALVLESESRLGLNGRAAPLIPASEAAPTERPYLNIGDIVAGNPTLRTPIIDGLLRQGETLNLVSTSKAGKTWLVHSLGMCIAAGQRWLGRFDVTPGRVLLLDNELHPQTLSHRFPRIAEALGINLRGLADMFCVNSLRGRLKDYAKLAGYFDLIAADGFKLIICDASYRFWPEGCDENKNADVARVYNTIDGYAAKTGAAFVLVHHASKGSQAEKSITDVGAGAGAQSRAADAHVVLRPHREDDAVVMEAVVRSWRPFAPVCLRWNFPTWDVDDTLDPTDLKQPGRKKIVDTEPDWTPQTFAERFITPDPQRWDIIEATAGLDGLGSRKAKRLLERAVGERIITVLGGNGRTPKTYQTG